MRAHAASDVLVLWDVDGTLVHTAGYGGGVFESAILHVLGAPVPSRLSLSGKTDRQIAQEYLALAGAPDHAHVPAVLERITVDLAAAEESLARDGGAFPGVEAALSALATRGATQTLLTGNVPENAAVKVAAFGLDRYLDLAAGSYGHEHDDRARLLPVAWERQRALYGREFAPERTWIIGDTPNDLRCARSGGARCLLVATGSFDVAALTGLGADAVMADLSDTGAVVDLIVGRADAGAP